jgi:hypothetical protein
MAMAVRSIRSIAAFVAASFLACAPISGFAQGSSNPAGAPAGREGNIYDFHEHQPTEADPSAATTKQVESEVQNLLKQTDELDRTFDNREGRDPSRR